jgi:hypothetical protein
MALMPHAAVPVFAAGPGYLSMARSRPVAVLVRDAETKQPIRGAPVHVSYPLAENTLAPAEQTAITAEDGIERVFVTVFHGRYTSGRTAIPPICSGRIDTALS